MNAYFDGSCMVLNRPILLDMNELSPERGVRMD